MTDEQASDWEYKIICCLGISTSNSDINVVGLHKTVTELYEQGRADEREAQVCCGDYEKCMKACTPRGRWLAEKELAKPEQEPVCDKDPFYCWSIRCQLGKVCKNAAQPEPKSISTNDHLCAMLRQVHDVLACTALPMKRKWVGLTDEEVNLIYAEPQTHVGQYAKAIEAKLKEKNNG